jgi:hypothetical protein
MSDARSSRRHHSLFHSRVVEATSGRLIGRTVDISDTGMRLIAESCPGPDQILDLRLELPKPVAGHDVVEFRGVVRWCHEDINTDYEAVGIELIDPSAEVRNIMQHLQHMLCFVD